MEKMIEKAKKELEQIDEIAKLICAYPQCINHKIIGGCKISECQTVDIAKNLYKQDYRKVVMCKDCKISDFGYFEKEIGKEAVEGCYCRKYREMKLPNDFCSDGVMKGN